jgi:hypothetical protein
MTMVCRHLRGGILRFGEFSPCRLILAATLLACTARVDHCSAQLCAQLSGVNFSENFNSLAQSGANNQIPNGFEFAFNESPGNLT